MRILVITHLFLPNIGGAELGIYEIYKRISKNNDVRILCPYSKKKVNRNYQYNFEVVRFKDSYGFHKLIGHRIMGGVIPPFSISALGAVRRNVDEFEPNVINLHYAIPYGLAVVKGSGTCPIVLSIIGREVPGPGTPYMWKHYIRHISRKVSDTIYISNYCRSQIFNSSNSNGHIIPYGVDVARFTGLKDRSTALRKKLNIAPESIVLFSLQRLSKEKRVDIVIKSFAILRERYDNIKLIVGGTGPEESNLKSLSSKLDLSNNILFTGYLNEENLSLYLNMCDIFVFHSVYETFGIVLVEAMTAAKPIVTVGTTAIPEVVDNEINGLITEPLNPKALAAAISKLLEDEKLREKLAINGFKKASREYNWDNIARCYEQVLKKASML
jgi:glycosyltransferase involved in cell wall biosynthesis